MSDSKRFPFDDEEAFEQALHDAAGIQPGRAPHGTTDRVMAHLGVAQRRRHLPLIVATLAAAALIAAAISIQFTSGEEAMHAAVDADTAVSIPALATVSIPTPRLELAVILPETGEALSRDRDGLAAYARAFQTAALLVVGGQEID